MIGFRIKKALILLLSCMLIFITCGCGAPKGGAAAPDFEDFGDVTIESFDEFSVNEERGFVYAEEENKSAFSLSVSSSSYTYMRRAIGSHTLPEQNSVRVEEYINYFNYFVPELSGEDFSAVTSVFNSPFGGSECLLRVTFKAKDYDRESAPCNIVILADTSASMYGADRLGLLKVAVEYLIGGLKNDDVISLVTYAGSSKVAFEGLTAGSRGEILAAVENLTAGGVTAGYDALTQAYAIASNHFIEGGNNRIVLFTDGDFNFGESDSESIDNVAAEYAQRGIYLSCVGVGYGNYKDATLEKLANAGGGATYYLDGKSEAKRVFGEQLTGTLVTVACDAKAQIEFDPSAVESYRLIGYDNRVLSGAQFENGGTDAGEIGSSHTVTALYQVRLKIDTLLGADIATATLRYRRPNETNERELSYKVEIVGEDSLDDVYIESAEKIRADDEFISCVAEYGMLLRGSKYCGRASFGGLLSRLSALELTDKYKIEFRSLVSSAAELYE